MALPLDLRARRLAVTSRMIADEIETLPVSPAVADRLGRMLRGLTEAAAELCAELGPKAAAGSAPLPQPACQVFDLITRRRLA